MLKASVFRVVLALTDWGMVYFLPQFYRFSLADVYEMHQIFKNNIKLNGFQANSEPMTTKA